MRAENGYLPVGVHGAKGWVQRGAEVTFGAPAVFLGARQGSQDTAMGRRGGGGGWFVRFQADSEPGDAPEDEVPVADVSVRYRDGVTDEILQQEIVLTTPLGVGNNPGPTAPYFSDPARAKPFMMLNMYAAMDASVGYFEQGDCASAVGIAPMMRVSYDLWSAVHQDPDIDADFSLLQDLAANIEATCNRGRGRVACRSGALVLSALRAALSAYLTSMW